MDLATGDGEPVLLAVEVGQDLHAVFAGLHVERVARLGVVAGTVEVQARLVARGPRRSGRRSRSCRTRCRIGLTDIFQNSLNAAPEIVAQVGWGPDGSDATADPSGWTFYPAWGNPIGGSGSNDEYMGEPTLPTVPAAAYVYGFRFSGDAGATSTYCDIDGNAWDNPASLSQSACASTAFVAMPDDYPEGITSTINVQDSFNLSNVTVEVDISHNYVGDLVVELHSPLGTITRAPPLDPTRAPPLDPTRASPLDPTGASPLDPSGASVPQIYPQVVKEDRKLTGRAGWACGALVVAATDFFTVGVLTLHELVRYHVLFVIELSTRRVERFRPPPRQLRIPAGGRIRQRAPPG